MNKKSLSLLFASLLVLVVISACGNKADSGNTNAANEGTATEQPSNSPASNNAGNAEESSTPGNSPSADPDKTPDASGSTDASSDEILIIIDQTEKPIEGNSFDFVVNKRPEGYMLSKMEWISDNNHITNTLQEAIEHGGSGGDGFYISGNGQFMGFFYPDDLKGAKGEVKITFANDQGKELSWKKTITLK
ncbi:hypothetical protein M3194_13425 [Paenibacillus glycanilyticus]|uniref:hypothetical protein n=1 Tax=Paenibacillus glycanilyticus TaxID=126569 RepID=UPI002041D33E|nr:hypothetical protein [Paenibacillus glycanilyticus]MCM3628367.1 hypothetical protein [Paenibacillus glycanilyticus]